MIEENSPKEHYTGINLNLNKAYYVMYYYFCMSYIFLSVVKYTWIYKAFIELYVYIKNCLRYSYENKIMDFFMYILILFMRNTLNSMNMKYSKYDKHNSVTSIQC